ncbi:MAG: divalent metal cation transporter [Armatimonadetes bacterium]|nr:divalent metal cation transporter [Armatimonadota bacterium]
MVEEQAEPKRGFLRVLGPGLITGASDDDPSGIATYSQAGAQFGFGMLWLMPFAYPFMAGIQETCADIGRVTGRGIAGNLRRYYPRWLLLLVVGMLATANTINLGADIGAMGDAVTLLVGGPRLLWAAVLAIGSLLLQVFVPYHKYVAFLKWTTLSLFSYVATVFVVHTDWGQALRQTVAPDLKLNAASITLIVGVLGTTISPYLFFWQASEEVEDVQLSKKEKVLRRHPEQAPYQMKRIMRDTYTGMAFANTVAFFIMLAVATTLHNKGITDIQSSAQAAQALRPLAGDLAFLLFTIGILGTGLLAIPVLAGSAAYAIGEALHWPSSLERPAKHAKGFYAVLSAAILIGLVLNLMNINPIKALFWTAVINGVAAGPIMIMVMRMATSERVMGEVTIGLRPRILGWAATCVMLAAAVTMFFSWGR